MKKLYYLLFISLLLIFFVTPINGQTFDNNFTTNQKTGFLYRTIIDNTSVKKGDSLNIKLGLYVSYFGPNVVDIHDVYLAVKLENSNTAFLQVLDHSFTGSITKQNYGFEIVLTFSIPEDAPNTSDLYIYAQFRENIPLSTDPLSYTDWTYVATINFTTFNWTPIIVIALLVGLTLIIVYFSNSNTRSKRQNFGFQKSIKSQRTFSYNNPSNQNILFCPNCGTRQDRPSNFCKNCGNQL